MPQNYEKRLDTSEYDVFIVDSNWRPRSDFITIEPKRLLMRKRLQYINRNFCVQRKSFTKKDNITSFYSCKSLMLISN